MSMERADEKPFVDDTQASMSKVHESHGQSAKAGETSSERATGRPGRVSRCLFLLSFKLTLFTA